MSIRYYDYVCTKCNIFIKYPIDMTTYFKSAELDKNQGTNWVCRKCNTVPVHIEKGDEE